MIQHPFAYDLTDTRILYMYNCIWLIAPVYWYNGKDRPDWCVINMLVCWKWRILCWIIGLCYLIIIWTTCIWYITAVSNAFSKMKKNHETKSLLKTRYIMFHIHQFPNETFTETLCRLTNWKAKIWPGSISVLVITCKYQVVNVGNSISTNKTPIKSNLSGLYQL